MLFKHARLHPLYLQEFYSFIVPSPCLFSTLFLPYYYFSSSSHLQVKSHYPTGYRELILNPQGYDTPEK